MKHQIFDKKLSCIVETESNVKITVKQQKQIVLDFIRELTGIKPDYFIKSGQVLYEYEVSSGSHGYTETVCIKEKSTQLDKYMIEFANIVSKIKE
jgi:hypothetical protein